MKTKILVFALSSLLIGPAIAQDKVIGSEWGIKAVIDDGEPSMPIAAKKYNKARSVAFTSYIADENGDINHYLKLSANDTIYYYIEYAAVYNTKVRFHYIWTGPEFYEYTTDWFNCNVNTYYWVYVYTSNNWKKGTYKLTIIAEQKTTGSGAECVETCIFRFY